MRPLARTPWVLTAVCRLRTAGSHLRYHYRELRELFRIGATTVLLSGAVVLYGWSDTHVLPAWAERLLFTAAGGGTVVVGGMLLLLFCMSSPQIVRDARVDPHVQREVREHEAWRLARLHAQDLNDTLPSAAPTRTVRGRL